MSPDAPLLAVDRLVKRFGGFRALDVLSFKVAAGEILGLSGRTAPARPRASTSSPGFTRRTADGSFRRTLDRRLAVAPARARGHQPYLQVPKPFLTLTVRENVEIAKTYGDSRDAPSVEALLSRSILPASPVMPRASSTPRSENALISRGRSRPVRGFVDR
jgi:branched-chain amino acid transport system ATP-binding protein